MSTARARSRVFVENDRVRVTEWKFRSGEATGPHRHAFDYVVVPMTDGRLTMVDTRGDRQRADLRAGSPYYREAGVEHDVLYEGGDEFRFIEIELK